MQLVFLDTCVLIPPNLRDVLLRMAEADLLGPLWSAEIFVELRRNLIPTMGEDRTDTLLTDMRSAFADAEVIGYERLIATMTNHPKDRHVLAAAVYARADVLVTANVKDFPTEHTGRVRHLRVLHPDAFLLEMLDFAPDAAIEVLNLKVKAHRRPPRDLPGLLDVLHSTVPRFAEAVRALAV